MPAVNIESRRYFSVDKDTKRVKTKADKQVFLYDAYEGNLKRIVFKPAEGEFSPSFQFIFDNNDGVEEVFQMGAKANYCHSVIGSLANNEPTFPIRLSPKEQSYTNRQGVEKKSLTMYVNDGAGEMIKFQDGFYDSLPAVEYIDVGGQKVANKKDRIEAIKALAEQVSAKYTIAHAERFPKDAPSPATASQPVDAADLELDSDDDDLPF